MLLGLVVAVVLGGWGRPSSVTATAAHSSAAAADAARQAARSVRALTGPIEDMAAGVPSDFVATMGYRPTFGGQVGDRELVDPRGGCSSPFGATRFDFDLACKHHDLGYDVLRYAARHGQPLGTAAREAVDARFGRDLRARCASVSAAEMPFSRLPVEAACQASALVYLGAVDLNSWRQGWGTPSLESAVPWLAAGAMGLLAAVVLGLVLAGHAGAPADPNARPGAGEQVLRTGGRRPSAPPEPPAPPVPFR